MLAAHLKEARPRDDDASGFVPSADVVELVTVGLARQGSSRQWRIERFSQPLYLGKTLAAGDAGPWPLPDTRFEVPIASRADLEGAWLVVVLQIGEGGHTYSHTRHDLFDAAPPSPGPRPADGAGGASHPARR